MAKDDRSTEEILQDPSTRELLAQMWEANMDRRRFLKRSAVAGAGAVALSAPAAASAALRRTTAADASLPKTFVYAFSGPVPRMDNNQNNLNISTAIHPVYAQLVKFYWPNDFAETQKLLNKSFSSLGRPELAQGWAISENFTKFKLILRKNVKSQFGNTFTADDVLWTVQKWFTDGRNSKFFMTATGLPSADTVTKLDDHTVQIILPAPGPLFLLALGGADTPVWDSTAAKQHATASDPTAIEWLSMNPAGWGPYQMTQLTPAGDRVAFKRRSTYFQKPTDKDVPAFIQESVPEGGNRLTLLLSGQAQYADALTPLEYALVKKRGMNVTHVDNTIVMYAVLQRKPPWDDPVVRQAIAKAIPYKQILKTVYQGRAKPYQSLLLPFVPGYTAKYWKYDTDPAAAKAVLSKLNTTMTLTVVNGLPSDQQVALLIQAAFNQAGLPTTIQGVERAAFGGLRAHNGLECFLASYIAPAFPTANYYGQVFASKGGPFNFTDYSTPAMEQAIKDAAPSNPRSVQNTAADTIQRLAMDDLVIHPIAWTGSDLATAPYLKVPSTRNAGGQIYWQDFQISR